MAGNKLNTKTKGKEDRAKASKGVTQNNDDSEDLIDFAVLRKPIPTSITGFAQARKIFDLATEELKDLLSHECDLLYECKVCRNIFRSLANFISHKRVYCKDKFNSTIHGHFVNSTSMQNEMLQIRRTEKLYQETLKQNAETAELEDGDERIPLTKDLTAVYEKIMKIRGAAANKDPQLVLSRIPSSSNAVFQNMGSGDKADGIRAEVQELDTILSRQKAVLQSDGKFIIESSKDSQKPDGDNVIQISDDDDNDDSDILKCKICELQFSTQKTLKFHMKYKHLESRLVYPCPDCLEIFSTSWSVYRHLFKVHRKTAAQIRRLRESIQSKAFRMNNPPAFYEKRKNLKAVADKQITEEERRDQENQAWMDNMEGDGELPRCGGCGRSFERRAALAAHTHTCQPRHRALARAPHAPPASATPAARTDAKKIEIQIRKDYNKGPPPLSAAPAHQLQHKHHDSDHKAEPKTEEPESKTRPTEDIEDKDKDDILENDKDEDDKYEDEAPMDVDDDDKSDGAADSPEKQNEVKPEDEVKAVIRLPYGLQAEKSNLAAFKQRIISDIDMTKYQCKKCESQHASALDLYEHMADHVKWMRYACKLCNFKHYNFDKLPEHVKVVHKLKGDTDFYYSTVKAIDGKEAMIISTCLAEQEYPEESSENQEVSPESRRPSRCSSDSSRLSDDSSSSSTLKETHGRKRKINQTKGSAKKKKDTNDDGEDQRDNDITAEKAMRAIIFGDSKNSPNLKAFEENSSDMDDIEDKITRTTNLKEGISTVHSRRPIRKRTKVKNADFEYDLSNLLKMEAQGYRDSQSSSATTTKVTPTPTIKPPQPKKKVLPDTSCSYETLNQDNCGALLTLSKISVETAAAHMRTSSFAVFSVKEQRSNPFVRPMPLPRILSRSERASPKKDPTEGLKDTPSEHVICKISETLSLKSLESSETGSVVKEVDSRGIPQLCNKPFNQNDDKNIPNNDKAMLFNKEKAIPPMNVKSNETQLPNNADNNTNKSHEDDSENVNGSEREQLVMEKVNSGNLKIPAVVPLKFRRESLELMKNPIINKNISEFSKSGMKTKILVIKPINRNNDGKRPANTLKFQTIKLKDSNTGSSNEDKLSDQVKLVKIPKVPCTTVSEKIALPLVERNVPSNVDSTSKKNEDGEADKSCNEEKHKAEDQLMTNEHANDKNCESTETVIAQLTPASEDLVEKSTNYVESLNSVEKVNQSFS